MEPIRGLNPRPDAGWPWHLTDDDVEYVRRFRVRPVRDSTWVPTAADEIRLDQEADGVRAESGSRPKRLPRPRRSIRHPWMVVAGVVALLGIAAVAVTLGIMNLQQIGPIDTKTQEYSTS